jgi:hypothetical protein
MKKQSKMHKYIYTILLSIASLGSFAQNSFNGGYTGIGLAYSYTKISIGNQTYGAKTPYFNFFGGWGLVKDKAYYGFEAGIAADQFAKKNEGKRLTKFFGLSASGRIGRVIQDNFLPYFSLGIRRDVYSLKKANPDDRFTAWMAVPAIGVDAFVENWFLVRSEVEYSFGLDTENAKKIISRKPKTLMVRAAAILKF